MTQLPGSPDPTHETRPGLRGPAGSGRAYSRTPKEIASGAYLFFRWTACATARSPGGPCDFPTFSMRGDNHLGQ